MDNISAIVISYNEEENIEGCLKSIQWCNEIVLVDANSTDATAQIAGRYNIQLFLNEWEGYSKQRKFALSKTKNDWVFVLDADERCSTELKNEIEKLSSTRAAAGYKIPRKSFFLNKWIKHSGWYPDYKMRLFDKTKVTVSDNLVHERYDINGGIQKLNNDIIHYTVRRLSDFIDKINKYSTLGAIEKKDKKKITFISLLMRPAYSFLREYIFRAGFLDGIHGLLVAYFNMATNIFTYAKIWEIQNRK